MSKKSARQIKAERMCHNCSIIFFVAFWSSSIC